jgi:uncharacterized RDD family membrane protein YckC
MNSEFLNINTTQHVFIEQKLASVGERLLSGLLDGIFLMFYYFVVSVVLGVVSAGSAVALIILFMLPLVFYNLFCELVFNGQTPAKMILRIRVTALDGSSPTAFMTITRWAFRLIDVVVTMGGLAIVFLIFSDKGQRLGDLAAGTTVIKIPGREKIGSVPFVNVPENHQVVYPQAKMLTDQDINLLREVLARFRDDWNANANVLLIYKAKEVTEKKLGITSGQSPDAFIDTILKDYVSLTGDSGKF